MNSTGVVHDKPALSWRLTMLNIRFGQQLAAFHQIWIAAAGREASTTMPSPASLFRSGRQTECAKIAIASKPAKYFDISAAPSASPHRAKSSIEPVRRSEERRVGTDAT